MSQASKVSAQDLAADGGASFSSVTVVGAILGAIGLAASFALAARGKQFYFSWLVAFMYFLSIVLGTLFFDFCLLVTNSAWGVTIRRVVENVMATAPLFALLFVPIWIGRHDLYPWTDLAEVAKIPALKGKSGYLNETFFLIRAVFFFVAWGGLALYFSGQSQKQDQSADYGISRRLRARAAPAIIVYALTQTFAAFDWVMSLDPEWYSTMFGVYYFAGSILAAFAFVIASVIFIQARGQLAGVVTVEHIHDLGKLLFAFTVFWTYIAFSQYFLIWYGNIPEETSYFMHRSEGSWPMVGKLLAAGHFAIPFFFLMPRAIKRSKPLLVMGAIWILVMHYVDLYWCVMPIFHQEGPALGATDAAAMLAVGGLFLSAFGWLSSRRSLVAVGDPRLPESLSFQQDF